MKKIIKKILALFLIVTMVCGGITVPVAAESLWDGQTVTAAAETKDSYQVSNAEELAWIAQQVSEGNTFAGKTIKLTADINLNEQAWIPIGAITVSEDGVLTEGTPFEGTFDGCNHTISGLNAENENGGVALFGYSTGVIKDLSISGCVNGGSYSAGLVAYGCGTISGVTNEVTVLTKASGNYVGGILGDASGDVTITDCHNKAVISNGGGSADKSTGKYGGIVGRIDMGTATIQNCSNTGDITGYQYISGIIGGCFGNVTIKNCYNTGTLTGISFGKAYVGGIVGKLQAGTIDSCYNVGNINITPWSNGHIRAVGGIAGCEENHVVGTAITNCYSVGTIELDTSKMASTKFIYLTGGISGGNNSDGNTMSYEDCFYLAGCIPSQFPAHPSYLRWNEMYRADNLLYDTEDIVACTVKELKSDQVLNALGDKFKASDDGYPVLYWQTGSDTPEKQSYGITAAVSGGTAVVTVAESAEEESTVDFTVSDIQTGKQVKEISVKDISGAAITVEENSGTWSFTMPSRAVAISVVLENIVAEDAQAYKITLPENMDSIWNIQVRSSQYDETAGTITEGASVIVIVEKNENALTSSFTGITAVTEDGSLEVTEENELVKSNVQYYGEYSFTMPGKNLTISVETAYADFTVSVETDGESELKQNFTREQMEAFSQENLSTYYSGWSTETEPFIGIAKEYITLEQLLSGSGVTFEKGDSLKLVCVDGYTQVYTWDYLMGTERCYYSDILENGTASQEGTAFGPAFILKGNMAKTEEEKTTLVCDTLNAYRFAFGQSEEELTGAVKVVDSMPKSVVGMTVIKSELPVDTNWYNTNDTEFTITTAAQLRGLAAIVNGTSDSIAQDNFSGKTVALANDIALDENNNYYTIENIRYGTESWAAVTTQYVLNEDAVIWTPIGSGTATKNTNASTTNAFAGIFDGKGYTVSGVYTGTKNASAGNTETVQGLFGVVSGTVKNVTVSGCITAKMVAGGIAAHLEGGTIENCINKTVVFTDGGTTPAGNVEDGVSGVGTAGGIVGNVAGSSSITNCINEAAVTCCNSNNGGRAGGIIGLIDAEYEVVISRNINHGRVDSYQYAGGIVGGSWSSSAAIENCVNTGYVTAQSSGMAHSGGIAAWSDSDITNCYNTGDVKVLVQNGRDKASHIGGIVADFAGTVITNCYNTGLVGYGGTATWATSCGSICGTGYGLTTSQTKLINCYMLEGTECENSGYANVKTADEMKAVSMVSNLGDAYTNDSETDPVNSGYPVLKWQIAEEQEMFEIISQPEDYTDFVGKTAVFTVETIGRELTYQWQYRNSNARTWYNSGMPGAVTAELKVYITDARNGQQYRCIITDANGRQLISEAATVYVKKAQDMEITVQPKDYTGRAGDTAVFTVEAEGGGLIYQWQYRNKNAKTWYNSGMPGAAAAELKVRITDARDGQQYRCIITDEDGRQLISEAVVLYVNKVNDIEITVQPKNYTGRAGDTAVFTVEAAGEGLTYQWQYRNSDAKTWYNSGMDGADTAELKVRITSTRNGQQYRCMITDATGNTVISDMAVILIGTAE